MRVPKVDLRWLKGVASRFGERFPKPDLNQLKGAARQFGHDVIGNTARPGYDAARTQTARFKLGLFGAGWGAKAGGGLYIAKKLKERRQEKTGALAGGAYLLGKALKPAVQRQQAKTASLYRWVAQQEKTAAQKIPFKALKEHRVDLTPAERAQVMASKAVWHHGPGGGPSPAVWKSVKDGKATYVTNTHRAYNTAPTLQGAIGRFHRFIKTTA